MYTFIRRCNTACLPAGGLPVSDAAAVVAAAAAVVVTARNAKLLSSSAEREQETLENVGSERELSAAAALGQEADRRHHLRYCRRDRL